MLIFFYSVWCVILCTYLLRNTRCEIALQVWKHSFSVSEKGLSTLQTALWKKLSANYNKGVNLCFCSRTAYTVPGGKVQFSHQTDLVQFCCQLCSRNSVNLANKDLLISQREQFPAFSWSEDYFQLREVIYNQITITEVELYMIDKRGKIIKYKWSSLRTSDQKKRNTMPIVTAQNYWVIICLLFNYPGLWPENSACERNSEE